MASFQDTSSSSTISLTLRKRKRRDSLVIHLSSPAPSTENDPTYTESEREHQPGNVSESPVNTLRSHTPRSKRCYACTFEGCTKTYLKPSRLAEHERSHTGDRPFVCSVCNKSYLRETHLQAHARTHLPSSAKPFSCAEEGCGKRFWTSQHLNVHIELHRGEKPFKCTEERCDAAFSKHHQLREHICTVHAPPGTKPYRCEHSGCTKSFTTNQKLTVHTKTHDNKRYACVHRSCLPPEGRDPTYYPTWSALQHHMRTVHPPTCPYASCGKTFSQQKGLRAHLKIHAQRDQEDNIDVAPTSGSENEGERPRKRRRGGEVGREWVCEVDGCDKDFKSKKALATHHNIAHLGRRDFVCPHEHCKRAFGYKHLLQRHLAKLHAPRSALSDHDPANVNETEPETDPGVNIDFLTGQAYISHAKESLKQANKLRCPFPHLPSLLSGEVEPIASSSKQTSLCEYVFSRAYDLRRHLHAEHGVDADREKVADWVRDEKGARATGGSISLVS